MSNHGNRKIVLRFQGEKNGMGVTWPLSLPLKHQFPIEKTNTKMI